MSASTELSDFVKALLNVDWWPELHDAKPSTYMMKRAGKKFKVTLQAFIRHEEGTLVYHVALRIGEEHPVENFVNPSLDAVKQAVGAYAAARMDSMTVVAAQA